MEHMNKHNKLKLCYMPLCKKKGSYKCSFLNTQSLHCHIRDVQASHTLKDNDVIMLCETRLSPHDLDTDYKMIHLQT